MPCPPRADASAGTPATDGTGCPPTGDDARPPSEHAHTADARPPATPPGCNGVGTECDHIVAGDDHDLDNLQWLSHECHKAKTERENAERNRRRKLMRLHPSERQPGLLDWTPRRVGGDSPATPA